MLRFCVALKMWFTFLYGMAVLSDMLGAVPGVPKATLGMKPEGLEWLTGSAVVLELSGPLGDWSIVLVPAMALPRIAESPVIGPAALLLLGRIPAPELIGDGAGPELIGPVAGAGEPPIAPIDVFGLGTVVAAPTA